MQINGNNVIRDEKKKLKTLYYKILALPVKQYSVI